MVYNEDVKMKLETYNQNISRKRAHADSNSQQNTKIIKKEKEKRELKVCKGIDDSFEYAEVIGGKLGDNSKDTKKDLSDNKEFKHEEVEKKKSIDVIDLTEEELQLVKDEKFKPEVSVHENDQMHKSEFGHMDGSDKDEPNSEGEENDVEYDEKEYLENLISQILVSPKKLKNILVFIDLQKVSNAPESSFSQVGCYFDENSFMRQIDGDEELHFQSFFSVTAPRLMEFNERPELWSKYFVFDEFYYKHPQQMIRCSSENDVLEKLCQYLAKIKLKYREVNICVAQSKNIKDLIRRINIYNLGQIFFPNVDGFVILEDVVKVNSVEDILKTHLKLSNVPEHSDVRSKLLYYAAFELLSDNYWDIHKFPVFKGLAENTKSETVEVKSRSLYIGDLSVKVTGKDLEKKISKVARPVSVKVCLHPKTGLSLGYAYANFDCEEKAEKVLKEFQSSLLLNKPMRIMYYNKKNVDRNSQLWRSNVFVKNLDSDVDNKRLQTAFSAYGQILSCKVETDDRGRSKCFGFVQFKSESSAWKAINDLHGLVINEKELYVCIKKSVRDRIDEEREVLSGKFLEVRNLSPETTNESFFALFAEFHANITCFNLDILTDEEKVGFVSFTTSRFASKALYSLDRKEVDGFRLIVLKRKERAEFKIRELKKKEQMQKKVEKDKRMFHKTEKNCKDKPMLDLRSKLLNKMNKIRRQ